MEKIKKTTLIYVSSVDLNESSGQGSFEKNFITHLTKKKVPVHFFTVNETILGVDASCVQTFSLGKKRIINYFSQQYKMFFSLRRYMKKNKNKSNNIIFVRESALVVAPVLIAKLFKIPLVMRSGPGHVNLLHYNKTKSSFVLWLYKVYNGFIQRANDKIIVVTKGIKRTLIREYNIKKDDVVVIPNPVNDSLFIGSEKKTDIELPQIKSDDFVFAYVGAVYFHQYVQDLIEAIHLLNSSNRLPAQVKVLIVGGGNYLNEIRDLITKYDLQNVIISTGTFKQHEASAYFEYCDCCVATYSKEFDRVKGSSALKIAEYLYFNKYVLAADIDDYVYLEERGFGKMYKIENPLSMAEKILEIFHNRNNLKIDSRSFVLQEKTADVIFDRYLQEIYATGQ